MKNHLEILERVSKFLEYCHKQKTAAYGVGLISNRDSIIYTDDVFERIFPSWNKLKFNDKLIPESVYDLDIRGIKDADLIDLKPLYQDENMTREYKIIKDLKDDYRKLMQYGGLYNYVVRLTNKYIESSNPAIIEHYAGQLTAINMFKFIDGYKLGVKKLLPYISQQVAWYIKGLNRYNLRYDEKKKRYEKNNEFVKWENHILKTKNRLPTQDELLDWEAKYEKAQRNRRTTNKNNTIIHEYVNPVEDEPGGRDTALDNIFSSSPSSIRMNPNDLKALKHGLYELLKGDLDSIQKKYLQLVLIDRDPKLWIGYGNQQRINQGYLAKKLNTTKPTIKKHLEGLTDKIRAILRNSGEFEELRDLLYESMAKRADEEDEKKKLLNLKLVRDLLSKLLRLNKKLL